jgi:hypothetical protein
LGIVSLLGTASWHDSGNSPGALATIQAALDTGLAPKRIQTRSLADTLG